MQVWNPTTIEQFKDMSSVITDFINFCRPDHQVAINPLAKVNRSLLETVSKATHSSTSTNVQENIFVQENMSNVAHGIISGGSFFNCSFNFHFKGNLLTCPFMHDEDTVHAQELLRKVQML